MKKKELQEAKYLFHKYYDKFTKKNLMHLLLALIFNYSNNITNKEQFLIDSLKECKR